MSNRRRLDAELVRRKLADSRSEAQRLIDARQVTVNGALADKAARQVDAGDAIELLGPPKRYVSRGGEKLAAALDAFEIDPVGKLVLDAGSSTGGFTDCCLQRGAARVIAVDVGYNQLHEKLRVDPRVESHERFHVKDLSAERFGEADLLVGDLSFISLTKVVEPLLRVTRVGGDLVLLVKPQFEAGRSEVSKGKGVITDPEVHARTGAEVSAACEAAGAVKMGQITSPIHGAEGNTEFLVWFRRSSTTSGLQEPS